MVMNKEDLMDELEGLVHLDFDAIKCYDQAIDEVDDPEVRINLERFRDDHERHVNNISALIRQHGGTPPARSRDIKGFFMEGFTNIRSQTGTEGALHAMETNEKMTNDRYGDVVDMDLPMDVRDMVEMNYHDEL